MDNLDWVASWQKAAFWISITAYGSNFADNYGRLIKLMYQCVISGAFTKLRKASSCPSFRLSIRPHATTRFPLEGFWWNLIFWAFSKICRENSSFIEIRLWITRSLHKDIFTFMTVSRWILLRMRNILDTGCRINENIFYFQYIFLNRALCKMISKNMVEPEWPQMTSQHGEYELQAG